mmetsp:Transcript_4870/g.10743  ORF Transcript_4870/g.10743 Transcript_4870/m.10743 type:complete len:80 (+) Transcript_4870:555-794(+)
MLAQQAEARVILNSKRIRSSSSKQRYEVFRISNRSGPSSSRGTRHFEFQTDPKRGGASNTQAMKSRSCHSPIQDARNKE